jgi:Fe-Mn family superoxide dismutase
MSPQGELAKALEQEFGSLDKFIAKFSAAAVGVQGSGWGWLGYNKDLGRIQIATTPNQDPACTVGLIPLLGIDVWEHAYYLQYKNVRPDYLKAVWKVVNWQEVGKRFAAAKQ